MDSLRLPEVDTSIWSYYNDYILAAIKVEGIWLGEEEYWTLKELDGNSH